MPRRKSVPDTVLSERLLDPLLRVGPDAFTFAQAAAASELSPATLVQRYGTRDGMIEAVLLRAWDQLDAATARADADAPQTPAGAVELLMGLTSPGTAERAVTDGLLLLREDIKRPLLRARGAAWGRVLAVALGRRLTSHPEDAERLGWQMASVWQGSQVWWAFTRTGPPEVYIREALESWCRSIGSA
jgi:AcrR family transcriptional regulator